MATCKKTPCKKTAAKKAAKKTAVPAAVAAAPSVDAPPPLPPMDDDSANSASMQAQASVVDSEGRIMLTGSETRVDRYRAKVRFFDSVLAKENADTLAALTGELQNLLAALPPEVRGRVRAAHFLGSDGKPGISVISASPSAAGNRLNLIPPQPKDASKLAAWTAASADMKVALQRAAEILEIDKNTMLEPRDKVSVSGPYAAVMRSAHEHYHGLWVKYQAALNAGEDVQSPLPVADEDVPESIGGTGYAMTETMAQVAMAALKSGDLSPEDAAHIESLLDQGLKAPAVKVAK